MVLTSFHKPLSSIVLKLLLTKIIIKEIVKDFNIKDKILI